MKNEIAISDEIIFNKIYLIREQKVMLDRDLAELYKLETKQLKRQVRRNIERFPTDFMFQLNNEVFKNWRSQFGTSNISDKMGLRYAPFAFTEQACPERSRRRVAMLSSVGFNLERNLFLTITYLYVFFFL
ncbi:MAG: ORF6N domain-containing protein [Flavobacteriaceae bacterium]|nr:ORF6N domain-containing protein [Flavobacteriaceae bacterium]